MKLSSALFAGAGLAAFASVLPLISAFGAVLIANAASCDLDEGTVNLCLMAGADAGPVLYHMFVMGWLFVFSFLYIPVSIGLGIAGSVVWARARHKPERNRNVSGVFWLLPTAAIIWPFALSIAIGLVVLGAYFWRRRKGQNSRIEGQG